MTNTVRDLVTFLIRVAHVGAAESALEQALAYAKKHQPLYEQELLHLVSIPSVSSLHEHLPDVRRAAEWLKKRLKSAGLEVQPGECAPVSTRAS